MPLGLPPVIDALVEHTEELDPSDVNNIRLRERLWLRGIEVLQDVFGSWDWDFRYAVDEPHTLTAGENSVAAPSDFLAMAPEGSIWVPSRNWEIKYRTQADLMRIRRETNNGTGLPRFFSVFGANSSGIPLLQFERETDVAYDAIMDYQKRCPIITDRPSAMTAATTVGSSTLDGGVYQFRLVFVTADGESFPGEIVSVTVAGPNTDFVTLTCQGPRFAPSWSKVTSLNLYATEAGGSTFYRHTTGILPTATTIVVTTDVTTATPLTDGYSGLESIPEDFVLSVFMEGVKVLNAYDKGDSRSAGEQEGRYRKNLARAKANYPTFEDKKRVGDQGLTLYRMH